MKKFFPTLCGAMLSVMVLTDHQAQAQTVYGLTSTNSLIMFDAANPSSATTGMAVTGLAPGHELVGMDFRPATGELFALGFDNVAMLAQLYTINTTNAMAMAIGTPIAIDASGKVGFDFNPTVDRIRVVTSNNKNYRLNPNNGAIAATDGDLAFASGDANFGTDPNVSAAGYTNSVIAATSTTLYVYDHSLNILATQVPPNDGVLNTVGMSGITVNAANPMVAMDIYYDAATMQNMAFLSANTGTGSMLYSVNPATGMATSMGSIGSNMMVKAMSVMINRTDPGMLGREAYGISSTGNLLHFYSGNSNYIRSAMPVTGIATGYMLMSVDFRPSNNMLYGMAYNANTMQGQLYTINTATGAATAVGSPLSGIMGRPSIDFNPVPDLLRVVTTTGQNYRIQANNGTVVATDGNHAYATGDPNMGMMPMIGSAGYTNSFPGATSTTLFVYDEGLNVLNTQSPPNNGTLNTIGTTSLNVTASDRTGMDIVYDAGAMSNTAYLTVSRGNNMGTSLYMINPTTAATTMQGMIGMGISVLDVAFVQGATVTCMSGNYTVNPMMVSGGTNFMTLAEAVAMLNTQGVCGPVTINIMASPTPYTGKIMLGVIPGSSVTNTVTINGNGNTLTFCSGNPLDRDIVQLNGTDNVTITNFVIDAPCGNGWGVHLMNDNQNVTISNNTINLNAANSIYGANMQGIIAANSLTAPGMMAGMLNDITISGNTINNGYNGIRINGNPNMWANEVTISDNILNNTVYFGIMLSYANDVDANGNMVNMKNVAINQDVNSIGMYLNYIENGLSVMGNKVANAGKQALWLNMINRSSSTRGMVVNNMLGGGMRFSGAIALQLNFASHLDVYYNSVNTDFGTNGIGFYVSNAASTNLNVMNNSFAYTGAGASGRAMQANNANTNFAMLNYNNYFSTGQFVWFNGMLRNNLTELQSSMEYGTMAHDMNSMAMNPGYVSATDLHVMASSMLRNNAMPMAAITMDFDGEMRTATPTIGADEYMVPQPRATQVNLTVDAYPNPFSNSLTIQLADKKQGSATVVLTDMMGREVYRQNLSLENSTITLTPQTTIAQGVYLLQINHNGNTVQTRVIKQ